MRGAAAGLIAALALAACAAPRHEQGWSRLRAGLSRGEVQELLGAPTSTYVPPPPSGETDKARVRGVERWQYGDSLSSLATRAVFPEEADERAWCVFFGPDGRVTGYRAPSWASDFRSVDPPPAGGGPPLR